MLYTGTCCIFLPCLLCGKKREPQGLPRKRASFVPRCSLCWPRYSGCRPI